MNEDHPWTGLGLPDVAHFRAKRIDANLAMNFFWALDANNAPMLLLQVNPTAATVPMELPSLNGIEVEAIESAIDAKLVFRLLDRAHIDVFHELCLDIVAYAGNAPTEQMAINNALTRVWRWHYLLRLGHDRGLSEMAQKGLIGELLFLERYLLESLGGELAVGCWTGPTGAPKDFEIGDLCVEAKVRRGAAAPFLSISSEDQLDTSAVGRLFLCVLNVSKSVTSDGDDCLTDIARRVLSKVEADSPSAKDSLEQRLAAAGFRWEDDYSSSRWLIGEHEFFDVVEAFPRVTRDAIPLGVSHVQYSLSLEACRPYSVEDAVVRKALTGENHAS